jgi:hypothetical protein
MKSQEACAEGAGSHKASESVMGFLNGKEAKARHEMAPSAKVDDTEGRGGEQENRRTCLKL